MENSDVLKVIYKGKADFILSNRDLVELHEWEFAKLFSFNPSNFMEDEFTLNVINRTYNRIKNNTIDNEIFKKANELIK